MHRSLMAKDVILSEAVQVTYKSGLNADIACTMPKTQDTYWYEDVKVKGIRKCKRKREHEAVHSG